MPTKKVAVPPHRAAQTKLFTPPNPSSPSWNQMSEAVKGRVIEALAQVLLRASGAEEKETLND